MRPVAALLLAAVIVVPAAGAGHAGGAASGSVRILYSSDWAGPMEIFAADPSGRAPVRQITFAWPDAGCYSVAACGFTDPLPSPDGRRLAFWSTGLPWSARTLWLANADGSQPRSLAVALAAAWSPDSRELAYLSFDGLHVVTVAGGSDRHVADAGAIGGYPFLFVRWSPDGRSLIFADRRGIVLLHDGHQRVLAGDIPDSLAWSPDGLRLAYGTARGIFIVSASGGNARRVYRSPLTIPECWPRSELTFSPNGALLGFQVGGRPGFLDTRTWRARTFAQTAQDISWSPDGNSLLFVQGCQDSNDDAMSFGDVRSVTPSGHIQTLVSAARPYGGQITSAAWAKVPASVLYRAAEPVSGVFAGGPVQKLVTDGDRVGYAACGGVAVWTMKTDATTSLQTTSLCQAPGSREGHVGTLALAGDRVLWWSAYTGLGFQWSIDEATLGSAPIEVAHGSGNLGSTPPTGSGTAVGGGSLLVISNWTLHSQDGASLVDQQTIQRVDSGGCPCPPISTSPGAYTPLDVDQDRIVVSGTRETRILAADGTQLLSLPVPTRAAQLSGSRLVIADDNQLQVYDTSSGALDSSWPLPAAPAGHDCDLYGDPSCNIGKPSTPLTLEDVAHNLAVYIYDGQVHLLRLSDGADRAVAPGTLARFTSDGLVYADGARIRFTPYDQLPLR